MKHIMNEFLHRQEVALLKVLPNVKISNITTLKEAFAEFDKNSDGFISKEELRQIITTFDHDTSEEDIDLMIQMADSDGNHLIDAHEFSNLLYSNNLLSGHHEVEDTKKLFHLFDRNNDGYISARELKTTMRDLGQKLKRKEIRQMIKAADFNKDGKISFSEFQMMLNQNNEYLID